VTTPHRGSSAFDAPLRCGVLTLPGPACGKTVGVTGVGAEHGQLRMELRALRLGAGATAERIAASSELYERLGKPPLSEAVAGLSTYVHKLGDDTGARAISSAFALDLVHGSDRRLAGRRSAFGRRSGLLPDAIERHEAAAINELVVLLTADEA
jgi:hypothetical protein